jgi:O-antigen/teichoic acid export membrane protein
MAVQTQALTADLQPAADLPLAELPPRAGSDSPTVGAGARGLRSLARAASGTFALNVFNTVATFAITALLARAMDVNDFGIYSWVTATVYLLTVPAILGADRLLVRDVAVELGRKSYGRVRGLVRWTSALVLAISLSIAALGALAYLIGGGAAGSSASLTAMSLIVGLAALPFIATARTGQAALMGFGQIVRAQIPEQALRPALFLVLTIASIVVLARPLDAPLVVGLYGASAAVALLVMVVLLSRKMSDKLAGARAEYDRSRWTKAAVALALLSGTMIVNSQTGVVLLGILDTAQQTAIYAVAQRGALLIAFPLLAVNVALAPMAARMWDARRRDELQHLVTRAARGVLVASIPLALLFIVFGGTVLAICFGSGFAAGADALAILSVGQLFNAAAGSVATLLIMSGNQWRAGLGIIGGAVLNIVLAVVLIPTLHAEGAAIAATASLIFSNTIHVIIARRTLGIDTTAAGFAPRAQI